ncbi:MAG: hypothetical protein LJE95_09850 [Acidobacteria bacterium]|jgi:hypothetical protein|nr:hypothetical protein [Acidobacteriota bacterium]
MRRRRTVLALVPLVVAVVMQLSPEAAWADYKSDYSRGLEAIRAQRWSDAEQLMSAAVAGNPNEGRVRLYGMHFEPYIPYYYLGLARFQLGDCSGALQAWATSESQGFISDLPEYNDLKDHRAACQERVASVEPTPKPTTKVPQRPDVSRALEDSKAGLQAAEAAATRVGELRTQADYEPLWKANPGLSKRAEDAAGILEQARAKLQAGERSSDEAELAAAAALAQQATAAYDGLRQDLEQRHRQAALTVPPSPTPERQAARATLPPEPTRPPLPTSAAPSSPTRQARPEPTAAPLRAAQPPERLRTAATAFFDAQYDITLKTLQGATFSDERAVATSHLLRAVATYALYLAGGEQDSTLHDTALAEAKLCLRIRPGLRLDPSLFSPRIAALFTEAR